MHQKFISVKKRKKAKQSPIQCPSKSIIRSVGRARHAIRNAHTWPETSPFIFGLRLASMVSNGTRVIAELGANNSVNIRVRGLKATSSSRAISFIGSTIFIVRCHGKRQKDQKSKDISSHPFDLKLLSS